MRLACMGCGKSVSSEVPAETVLRACAICPECLQAESTRVRAYCSANGIDADALDSLSVGIGTEPVREPTR